MHGSSAATSANRCDSLCQHTRFLLSFAQAKSQQDITGDYGYVLFSIDLIRHRPIHDLRAKIDLPEQSARACVQRVEISFPAACEEKVARRGQNAAVADVILFEFPFMLAGPRIDSDDSAVADRVGPIINWIPPADADAGRVR